MLRMPNQGFATGSAPSAVLPSLCSRSCMDGSVARRSSCACGGGRRRTASALASTVSGASVASAAMRASIVASRLRISAYRKTQLAKVDSDLLYTSLRNAFLTLRLPGARFNAPIAAGRRGDKGSLELASYDISSEMARCFWMATHLAPMICRLTSARMISRSAACAPGERWKEIASLYTHPASSSGSCVRRHFSVWTTAKVQCGSAGRSERRCPSRAVHQPRLCRHETQRARLWRHGVVGF